MPLWKAAAVTDHKRMTQYIAKDNPRAAVEMGDTLMQKAEKLDHHPALGRVGRVPNTRELVVHPNYILIYRVVDGMVEILRVLHAAQQWPREGEQLLDYG